MVVALILLALVGAALAVVARRRPGWRRAGSIVAVVGLLAAVGAAVNTRLYAYPNVGSLSGTPRFPMVDRLHPTSNLELENGAAARISVPDTASHFGVFDAQVYLPPQYFTEPERRFPVVVLTHGNPGSSTEWLDAGSAAATGLAVARGGHPVILVMPTVLQEPDGDSLCVDTAREGNAETYVVKDVVAAADTQLRTHARGGASGHRRVLDGRVLRTQPRPEAPGRVLGDPRVLGADGLRAGRDRRGQRGAVRHPGLGAGGRRQQPGRLLAAARPEDRAGHVARRRRGRVDGAAAAGGVRRRASPAAGFTVEYHERPGGHDFGTWTPALQESLPWAAARLGG